MMLRRSSGSWREHEGLGLRDGHAGDGRGLLDRVLRAGTPLTLIRCETCQADAPIAEYAVVFRIVPLTAGGKLVGHVAVLRHRICDAMSAAVVKLKARVA